MNNEICNIQLCKSRLFALGITFFWLLLAVLIKYAQIDTLAKFCLLCAISIFIVINYYLIEIHDNISSCDVLFLLKNIVCWEKNTTSLYTIEEWYSIGNVCIIIKLSNNQKIRNLFIFRDSCNINTFNHLMRHIKWAAKNK